MNSVTLENFRCFGKKRTVRLAPLTLLVGENSTGKTSFLAAVRALASMGGRFGVTQRMPTFREEPYDLGTFREIIYGVGERKQRAQSFTAGYEIQSPRRKNRSIVNSFDFVEKEYAPYPRRWLLEEWRGGIQGTRDAFVDVNLHPSSEPEMVIGKGGKAWRGRFRSDTRLRHRRRGETELGAEDWFWTELPWMLRDSLRPRPGRRGPEILPLTFDAQGDAPPFDEEVSREIERLVNTGSRSAARLYAGAPVRAQPRRTYEMGRVPSNLHGASVPVEFAAMSRRNPEAWSGLHERLVSYGAQSGLFDEIRISEVDSEGELVRIQVRKRVGKRRGPWRNLTNVGYGVSQALPILSELLNSKGRSLYLLQQPEVHLHPRAQAALGTGFCELAGDSERPLQIVVETHSDHLINRVRMDVRDRTTSLPPEGVMILYFERQGPDVLIHEVTIDEEGNIVGAPASYGQFFMEETSRSLGI